MAQKAQHTNLYSSLPGFLRQLREEADLTQRALGAKLLKAQSWVYNCETGNRRVDITEFIAWASACGNKPEGAFDELLERVEVPAK